MTFTKDMQKFKEQAVKNAEIVFKKIAGDMAELIIERTPVDTGRAKGNWHVSLNSPVDAVFDVEDRSGQMVTRQAKNDIQGASVGGSVFVLNNLPYIPVLEDGGSMQATNGMVKVSVSQYRNIAKRAARAVLNKTVRDFS